MGVLDFLSAAAGPRLIADVSLPGHAEIEGLVGAGQLRDAMAHAPEDVEVRAALATVGAGTVLDLMRYVTSGPKGDLKRTCEGVLSTLGFDGFGRIRRPHFPIGTREAMWFWTLADDSDTITTESLRARLAAQPESDDWADTAWQVAMLAARMQNADEFLAYATQVARRNAPYVADLARAALMRAANVRHIAWVEQAERSDAAVALQTVRSSTAIEDLYTWPLEVASIAAALGRHVDDRVGTVAGIADALRNGSIPLLLIACDRRAEHHVHAIIAVEPSLALVQLDNGQVLPASEVLALNCWSRPLCLVRGAAQERLESADWGPLQVGFGDASEYVASNIAWFEEHPESEWASYAAARSHGFLLATGSPEADPGAMMRAIAAGAQANPRARWVPREQVGAYVYGGRFLDAAALATGLTRAHLAPDDALLAKGLGGLGPRELRLRAALAANPSDWTLVREYLLEVAFTKTTLEVESWAGAATAVGLDEQDAAHLLRVTEVMTGRGDEVAADAASWLEQEWAPGATENSGGDDEHAHDEAAEVAANWASFGASDALRKVAELATDPRLAGQATALASWWAGDVDSAESAVIALMSSESFVTTPLVELARDMISLDDDPERAARRAFRLVQATSELPGVGVGIAAALQVHGAPVIADGDAIELARLAGGFLGDADASVAFEAHFLIIQEHLSGGSEALDARVVELIASIPASQYRSVLESIRGLAEAPQGVADAAAVLAADSPVLAAVLAHGAAVALGDTTLARELAPRVSAALLAQDNVTRLLVARGLCDEAIATGPWADVAGAVVTAISFGKETEIRGDIPAEAWSDTGPGVVRALAAQGAVEEVAAALSVYRRGSLEGSVMVDGSYFLAWDAWVASRRGAPESIGLLLERLPQARWVQIASHS